MLTVTLVWTLRAKFCLLRSPPTFPGCPEEWISLMICCIFHNWKEQQCYICKHRLLPLYFFFFFLKSFEDFGSNFNILNSILVFALPHLVFWWVCAPCRHIKYQCRPQRTYPWQRVKWILPPQTDASLRHDIWFVVYHSSKSKSDFSNPGCTGGKKIIHPRIINFWKSFTAAITEHNAPTISCASLLPHCTKLTEARVVRIC